MAQIKINEISQNYTYNIGTNSFATVAMPITACWGPAYTGVDSYDADSVESALEEVTWDRFPATQAGLEAFVSTYRGPASNYRLAEDYSYQMAMTLLTAGYDVLVCRVCPGYESAASAYAYSVSNDAVSTAGTLSIKAKYPGSFGDNLRVNISKVANKNYWNMVVYVVDSSQVSTAVENLVFVFERENSTDTILHIDEIESKFVTLTVASGTISDSVKFASESGITDSGKLGGSTVLKLSGGADRKASVNSDGSDIAVADILAEAVEIAKYRYADVFGNTEVENNTYIKALTNLDDSSVSDTTSAATILYKEWLYTSAYQILDLLQDKLNYNPNRLILPGWDDQDLCAINMDTTKVEIESLSPLHIKLMDTAYYSRCATAMLDVPKSCARSYVYSESVDKPGYAQMLSRYPAEAHTDDDVNVALYTTHSALFAPWCSYKYVGTGKKYPASPAFIALMIQRAMILNQPLQYEWALPTNRKHTLDIGKGEYKIPKKILDVWQKSDGVGVNIITEIPELGTSLWGNSTLYELPPATYQALADLSTRYLVNAVEDVAYKCGISITFQYNNEQAYNMFYAGVTPILDTMRNCGAIIDYHVKMSADIDGLDRVRANTVIGKIYLVVSGVIHDIVVDLIALPPGTDLNQYRS